MSYAFCAGLFLGGGLGIWIALAFKPLGRGYVVKELTSETRRRK